MKKETPSSNSAEQGENAGATENQSQEPTENSSIAVMSPAMEMAAEVLAFYKKPETKPMWLRGTQPLPPNVSSYLQYVADQINQIKLAFGEVTDTPSDEDDETVAEHRKELTNAALFFVRKVLLAKGGDHYRVLGLTPPAQLDQVQSNYRNLRRLHWNQEQSEPDQIAVMRISEAYVVLREPQAKREYTSKTLGRPDNVFIGDNLDNVVDGDTRGDRSEQTPKNASTLKRVLIICGALALISGILISMYYRSSSTDQPTSNVTPSDSTSLSASGGVDDVTSMSPMQSESAIAPSSTLEVESNEPDIDEVALIDTLLNAEPADNGLTSQEGQGENSTVSTTGEISDEALLQRIDDFVNAPLAVTENPSEQDVAAVSEAVADDVSVEASPPTVVAQIDQNNQNDKFIEVIQLLAKGQRQIEQSRLTKPVGDNAYETYLSVLEKDPGNVDALAGLEKIAQKYVGLAAFRVKKERYDDALGMVQRGLDVLSNYKPLLAMEAAIKEKMGQEPAAIDTENSADNLDSQPDLAVSASVDSDINTFVDEPSVESEFVSDNVDVSGDLTEAELDRLIADFVSLYELGDLDSFLALFSDDAKTNNRASKVGVKKDYQSLFDSTSKRLIRLQEMRWSIEPNEAIGEADFRLTLVKTGEVRPRSYEGSLTFQVLKDDQVLITGLYHSQKKIEQ